MLKKIALCAFLLTIFTSFKSGAEISECVELVQSNTAKLELRSGSEFFNCMTIGGAGINQVLVTVLSDPDTSADVEFYNMNSPSAIKLPRTAYDSTIFSVNTSLINSNIGIRVKPIGKAGINRNAVITYLITADTANIVIDITALQ